MSSSAVSSPTRSTFDAASPMPNLLTFVNSVPPQLTLLLASLGPYIARIRWFSEVVSWKTSYADSWLLLGAWWTLCLLSEFTFRYFLLLVITVGYTWLSLNDADARKRPALTEQNMQSTVIDLSVIESLLPTLAKPPVLPGPILLRVAAILYVPSLILVYFIRARIILGVLGTLVFVWRAPWACTIRTTVWRSSWFRWGISRLWGVLSGQSAAYSTNIISESSIPTPGKAAHSSRFLFTVYENQRWWMGLDWTAALLPGERPSWCSATQEPMSPPSAFSLPPPVSTITGDGKGGLVKRSATWRWEEGEWKVVVKPENSGVKRVEKEPPSLKDEASVSSSSKMGKAKMKATEMGHKLRNHGGSTGDVENANDIMESPTSPRNESWHDEPEDDDGEPNTDVDGWVYGDNKWKASSHSNGIGKYTRFRKWTRIAILTEIVEPVSSEEAHDHTLQLQQQYQAQKVSRENSLEKSATNKESSDDSRERRSSEETMVDEEEQDRMGLRKRLKAVVKKATH